MNFQNILVNKVINSIVFFIDDSFDFILFLFICGIAFNLIINDFFDYQKIAKKKDQRPPKSKV